MKLYGAPFSCALASNIVLKELAITADYDWVQLSTKRTISDVDYAEVNPKGKVPALILKDGSVLTEGVAIMMHLADLKPEQDLLPPLGSPERAVAMEWLVYISTEVHKKIFYPVFNPHAPAEAKQFALSMLPTELSYIESVLAARAYLAGDSFTPADAYFVTTLNWATFLKTDFTPYPHIMAYRKKVMSRPAVAEAFAQEGALYESNEALRPDAK